MSPDPPTPRRTGPLPVPAPDALPAPAADEGSSDLTGPARLPGTAGPSGVGRTPPDVSFTTAQGPGTEDGSIAFGPDSALVAAEARAGLAALVDTEIAASPEPVTATVHGYASVEGDAIYNENLSAHRAAAVARALVDLLPPGSQVRLVAHGETSAFGPDAAANRRAGVDLEPRGDVPYAQSPGSSVGGSGGSVEVADDGEGHPVAAHPDAPAPTATGVDQSVLPPLPRLVLGPGLLEPTQRDLADVLGPGRWRGGSTPPLSLFDPAGTYRPLHERGIRLDDRWMGAIEAHYAFWFLRLHQDLGLRADWAAWIANTGTGVWVDTEAARERPTATDEFNRQRDIDHALQGGWKTPVVPLHPTLRFDLSDLFRK